MAGHKQRPTSIPDALEEHTARHLNCQLVAALAEIGCRVRASKIHRLSSRRPLSTLPFCFVLCIDPNSVGPFLWDKTSPQERLFT